jgi:hypothetical protein
VSVMRSVVSGKHLSASDTLSGDTLHYSDWQLQLLLRPDRSSSLHVLQQCNRDLPISDATAKLSYTVLALVPGACI